MLLAILAIYFNTGAKSFDIVQLAQMRPFSGDWVMQSLAFWAFFVAFAIKVPVWPFHTWLPDAHVEAPTAGSVILAGVLLKLGCYGMFRILLPIFPRRGPGVRLRDRHPGDDQHCLRRAGGHGPDRL